ncbi:MAG: hypothetical protein WB626_06835 [Bacteroidota bacterium]
MAKQQSFADKAMKGAAAKGAKCPTCGTVFQPVLMVASEYAPGSRSWKFNERRIQICKCNEKQVYA